MKADETFLVTERNDWIDDTAFQQQNNEEHRMWVEETDKEAQNKSLQKWNDFLQEKYK